MDATTAVAIVGAAATVGNGLVANFSGYFLGRRTDIARDALAAARETEIRALDRAKQVKERQHEWQRNVLLELQDELAKLARVAGQVLLRDQKTVREQGRVFLLPNEVGGEEFLAATVAVQRLRARVLADDLRAEVAEFLAFCAEISTGIPIRHKDSPREVLEPILADLYVRLGQNYGHLVDQLGAHIRDNELWG